MPPSSSKSSDKQDSPSAPSRPTWLRWLVRATLWMVGLATAAAVGLALTIAVALAVAYPNLPDISDLADYRPKLPLRVYSAEGALLGEFGEERRNLTPIGEIPKVMKDAVLAIEDARFFQHGGVDYKGVIRAALANLGRVKSQGASTITMQVARNVYLSSEKTFTRKIYEILLTFKLEHLLTKDQILEIYMNQIYLGNRAYGFAAASEAYFGKPLKSVSVAEAAMLAGLPKAPSAYNPISNPKRARSRQLYIIERMEENGFITAEQATDAKKEELKIRTGPDSTRIHAEYVAEMARQLIFTQYGNEAYTRGLNVYTTLNAAEQEAAYAALRRGIMDYERRQQYRGPEKFVVLPTAAQEVEDAIDDALANHPDNGDVLSAVVLEASPRKIVAARANGDTLEITGDGLKPAQSGLSDKAAPNIKVRRGAVIRVVKTPKNAWEITQLPEVEGALVALDPRTGAIRALVGGFDFDKNKFNHAAQAWRQPGSSFKPFIYSAALEKGFTPATVINDAPLFFDAGVTGGQPWEPKNYDGKYDGPMSMRTGLAKSKNMISIRILQAVGPKTAQEWISRFGFDAEKHPAYLTMALGAGSVTPLQMATAYSVFANGGYRVNPWLITKVTDHKGRVISETTPPVTSEQPRAIDARNAFVMNSLLQEVTRSGTAARAQATLKRPDLYGKTGTTNDSVDAWFAGYQPTIAAVTWIGYDTPRNLGSRETGGGLSLPVWINFMERALKGVPVMEPTVPAGVVNVGGEWFYDEYARNSGIPSVGLDDRSASPAVAPQAPPPTEERNRILDLFRN
ncbi:MAG: penicillin-binding protein [Burkholderiales bacterium RIFCSPHIGHO2_12_FULL_65_48]|uniref:penicillin-binding protein 1A n=1 Tax=unclassified Acidovorax TaxID=2684926 RepID=UPI0008D6BAD4|nr:MULTISPECIES: penicillin-binding protein 1A [unclassified Acidovorax]OGB08533.1 MAG: penicillin-binding protein [Burkholderiales bacterium RIFCSPHIGHO2_02_FULL_64_19]OGB15060.1 MAG: penicillin-binding protein [Burkholderiales bacterium RIFCSPHIGHO2_12_FULL_65_48]OGB58688.1 MAG: penicillin-binding protein [Burkholderiales bacterium RIFCSPLOWO2_12_FULL_64_33]MBV7458630.1 penicillin-binding protein 1A [Acidovorax sp. sif0632]MBV7463548.1 penicillin-binding protein 1A [Acidovorax sp. sif0613]